MGLSAGAALIGASALHLGFQAVVTLVVYPALADVPVDRFAAAHAAHTRRITTLVVPVYGLLAAACLWALVAGPRGPWVWLAAAGSACAAGATALVAGPTHGRLSREGPTAALANRLHRADVIRLTSAAVACGSALLAAN